MQAFSISQIATAYCDAGQNYKNLVGYVKGLSEAYSERIYCTSYGYVVLYVGVKFEMDVNFGCGVE